MESKISFKNCGDNDVLAFNSNLLKVENISKEVEILLFKTLLGVKLTQLLDTKKILQDFSGSWSENKEDEIYTAWFNEGVNCELLQLGAPTWKKGKVKINVNVSLEFLPDESQIVLGSKITETESKIKYQSQPDNQKAA